MVISAAIVIGARNPVYSVLFLILAFCNAAGLLVLIGAEFLAMMLIIIYVGAVAVLFLFVVMMLDINLLEIRAGFQKYLPVFLVVWAILLVELLGAIWGDVFHIGLTPMADAQTTTNSHQLGNVLYTDYIYLFQITGLILLVAMVGAIMLAMRKRPEALKQNIESQNRRRPEDVIEIIKSD